MMTLQTTMTVADLLTALAATDKLPADVRKVLTEILYAAATFYQIHDGYETACWPVLELAADLVLADDPDEWVADDIVANNVISHLYRIAYGTLEMDGLSPANRAQLWQIKTDAGDGDGDGADAGDDDGADACDGAGDGADAGDGQ